MHIPVITREASVASGASLWQMRVRVRWLVGRAKIGLSVCHSVCLSVCKQILSTSNTREWLNRSLWVMVCWKGLVVPQKPYFFFFKKIFFRRKKNFFQNSKKNFFWKNFQVGAHFKAHEGASSEPQKFLRSDWKWLRYGLSKSGSKWYLDMFGHAPLWHLLADLLGILQA